MSKLATRKRERLGLVKNNKHVLPRHLTRVELLKLRHAIKKMMDILPVISGSRRDDSVSIDVLINSLDHEFGELGHGYALGILDALSAMGALTSDKYSETGQVEPVTEAARFFCKAITRILGRSVDIGIDWSGRSKSPEQIDGRQILATLESARATANTKPEALRVQHVVLAILRGKTGSDDIFFFRKENSKFWDSYGLFGGKVDIADDPSLTHKPLRQVYEKFYSPRYKPARSVLVRAMRRELSEEIGLAPNQYVLELLEHSPITELTISQRLGCLTDYQNHMFSLRLLGNEEKVIERGTFFRWIDIERGLSGSRQIHSDPLIGIINRGGLRSIPIGIKIILRDNTRVTIIVPKRYNNGRVVPSRVFKHFEALLEDNIQGFTWGKCRREVKKGNWKGQEEEVVEYYFVVEEVDKIALGKIERYICSSVGFNQKRAFVSVEPLIVSAL